MAKTSSDTGSKKPSKSSTKPPKITKPPKPHKTPPPPASLLINAWEQDPGASAAADGGTLIQRSVPQLSATPLPTKITHPSTAPAAGVYMPATAEFRYWACADALRRGSDFWGSLIAGVQWQVGATLPVDLDHGQDLNAYYDRVGLRFFHGSVRSRTFYSGESPDVVCHELGHALLDAIKPQLWDAASLEVAAFHESFGDMSALLTALQLPSVRHSALAETQGVLYRSSALSRLAEQLGWAIRQSYPDAVESDCLRNAVNSFSYTAPQHLPSSGPASVLSAEAHSFSRVFTAAFFEGLAGMFKAQPSQDENGLLRASHDAATLLVAGIGSAAVVPAFYSQVAAQMILAAKQQFAAQPYAQALKSAFVRHGILSPAAAATTETASPRGMAEPAAELARVSLSVAEYGLSDEEVHVYAPSQAAQLAVAGGARGMGSSPDTAPTDAARAFLEHLLRRGRLKPQEEKGGQTRGLVARSTAPDTHETHTHELRREGKDLVLRRLRIDCGPYCTHH